MFKRNRRPRRRLVNDGDIYVETANSDVSVEVRIVVPANATAAVLAIAFARAHTLAARRLRLDGERY
jgi:hypothetical protein